MELYNRIGTNNFIIRQLSLTFYLLDLAKRSNIFNEHCVWLTQRWVAKRPNKSDVPNFNDHHLYFMRVCKCNIMKNATSYYLHFFARAMSIGLGHWMIKLFRLCNSNIWVKLFKLDQTWGSIQIQNAMLRDLVKRSNIKFIDPTSCCMQMFIYIARLWKFQVTGCQSTSKNELNCVLHASRFCSSLQPIQIILCGV